MEWDIGVWGEFTISAQPDHTVWLLASLFQLDLTSGRDGKVLGLQACWGQVTEDEA